MTAGHPGCTGSRASTRPPGRPRTSCPRSSARWGPTRKRELVFFLDRKRNTVVLDLETRRVRPQLEQVRYADRRPGRRALHRRHRQHGHPTGAARAGPIPLEAAGQARGAVRHDGRYPPRPRRAIRSPALEVLGSDQPPESSTPRPTDRSRTSLYGDLVAVAADTAVVIYDPGGKHERRSIPGARSRAGGALLPVGASDLRRARRGRAAGTRSVQWRPVVRPRSTGSGARAPLGRLRAVAARSARPRATRPGWSTSGRAARGRGNGGVGRRPSRRLPPGTPADRRGSDVVVLDLSADGLSRAGSLDAAATDAWLPLAWRPARRRARRWRPTRPLLAAEADSGRGRGVGLPAGQQLAEPVVGERALATAQGRWSPRIGARAQAQRRSLPRRARSLRDPRTGRRDRPEDRNAVVHRHRAGSTGALAHPEFRNLA